MRSGLILLFALFPSVALAMDPCRSVGAKSDAFGSDETTVKGLGLSITAGKAAPRMDYNLAEGGVNAVELQAGFEITWLLENGSKITFVSDRPTTPTGTVYASQYSAGVITNWLISFPLDPQSVHLLAQSPVKAIRWTTATERTVQVNKGAGNYYQRQFACIANTIGG